MYIHLGEETIVNSKNIVGIFDMDTSTVNKSSRNFLARSEKEKKVVNVSYELPKSFVLCSEKGNEILYISQLSSKTLLKRSKNKIDMLKD